LIFYLSPTSRKTGFNQNMGMSDKKNSKNWLIFSQLLKPYLYCCCWL
jgi:hypothetical protein